MIRALALLLPLLAARVDAAASRPVAPPVAAEAPRLRARAAELFAQRERARRGGVALDRLHDDLVALADTLERAGLDSLAADALRKAGGVAQRTARERLAEAEWRRAIVLARRAGDSGCEIDARSLLAQAVSQRDPEMGLRLGRDVVSSATRHRRFDVAGDAWFGVSNALASMGRMRDAREAALQSLALQRKWGDATGVALALQQVAQCWHAEGQDARALTYADSAVAVARRESRTREPLARALVARANARRDLGQADRAHADLVEALAVDRQRGDVRHALRTRNSLTILLAAHGMARQALAHADTMVGDARRSGDGLMESRAVAARAYALAELSRWSEVDTLLAGELPRFERRRDTQDEADSRAGRFLRGGEMYATWARALVELGRVEDAWRVTERGRAAVFRRQLADGDAAPSADLRALQARLRAANATLLQYSEPQRNPQLVFVIDADSVRALSLGRLTVEADAKLARDLLAGNAPASQSRELLARIARTLLEAPLRRVRAERTRLWILPPSEAEGLPFEVLPVAGGTLGSRWAVSYPPSVIALEQLAARTPAERGMVVFADPDARAIAAGAEAPRLRALARTPLPGAREEARRIAPFGTRVWSGRDATPARLADARGQAVLHLATHAWMDPAHPAESGLLLAGADGLVTPARVESLDVRADLVTMSGCRTAQGRSVMGEGMFGLARAFLVAGARSVVATLWEVDDRAATRFMTLFYEQLRRGAPRDEALQRARLAMRAERWPLRDTEAFVLAGLGSEPVSSLAGRGGSPGR